QPLGLYAAMAVRGPEGLPYGTPAWDGRRIHLERHRSFRQYSDAVRAYDPYLSGSLRRGTGIWDWGHRVGWSPGISRPPGRLLSAWSAKSAPVGRHWHRPHVSRLNGSEYQYRLAG